MNQNQNVDNDLQKAIDDITKTTNVDPVFSDPVAAPSSIPEGDTGKIEPVGPFPEPIPEPIPAPVPEPVISAPAPEPIIPEPIIETVSEPEPTLNNPNEQIPQNAAEVKKAALRDLAPLMNKVQISSEERFNIYRNIFEELNDYTVLEPAYQAARGIDGEEKRAEALLYLIEAIDKM